LTGKKEVVTNGGMGATYGEMKIVGYDPDKKQWLKLLAMGTPQEVDMDGDGQKNWWQYQQVHSPDTYGFTSEKRIILTCPMWPRLQETFMPTLIQKKKLFGLNLESG
jgi:hypothetical protein